MAGKFELRKFAELDINDPFFDQLKADYPGTPVSKNFVDWFQEKATEGRTALVFNDDLGLGAFVCINPESEEIPMKDGCLPKDLRLKVCTLCIAERYRGQRLGEGAIGLVLWKWRDLGYDEIYLTTFEKQDALISQLEKFGFAFAGYNTNSECIYIKSRKDIDYTDPYKAFPFINPAFQKGGYLIIDDYYHDTMFPYSELKNTLQNIVAMNVTNGLSKIYVGAQYTVPTYQIDEPVFIYRRFTGDGVKRYKSCLTSYCVITDVIAVKKSSNPLMSFDELITRIGNKSVFDKNELLTKYNTQNNMYVIEMLYYGYFGEGHNVTMDWLDKNELWPQNGLYPTLFSLTPDQCKQILKEGNIDVDNVIIN